MGLLSRIKDLGVAKGPKFSYADGSNTACAIPSVQDKSVPSKDRAQRQWRPPKMVEPDSMDEFQEDGDRIDLGSLSTDAMVFRMKVKRNGKIETCSVLKLPSSLPSSTQSYKQAPNTYNILLVDVSASMSSFWNPIQEGWNKHIAPQLKGRTIIYTFGTSVVFRRMGTTLKETDFDGGGTDLTGALQTLINEVYVCKEKYVNIFIVTDGDHNSSDVAPRSVIDQIQSPLGKICNVYILGVGDSFPVQYSVDIRSRLHNGSLNFPYIFWAKHKSDIWERITEISNICNGSVLTVKLEIPGFAMPGLVRRSIFTLNEWVYFSCDPSNVQKLGIRYGENSAFLELAPQEANIAMLEELFRQWNSLIIQRNGRKEDVPRDIFNFMEGAILCLEEPCENVKSHSISQRQLRKELKSRKLALREQLSKMKIILTTTKFENQLELADKILSTTVITGKYKMKYLKYKGYTDADYAEYCREFEQVYKQHIAILRTLPVTLDDCCRVTMTSTLSDLQDLDFLKLLQECNKFEFLKTFTISGIPVISPIRDSVGMNPWSYSVSEILTSPYAIMSQVAMESYAGMKRTYGANKLVQLKDSDDDTRYNAVIPIFPPSFAKAMQPIVWTRLYAMCVTFALWKNPHVINYDLHMASLAAAWVFSLYENPSVPRPQHALIRMKSIEATAQLYIEMPRYAKYIKALHMKPSQALMTESLEMFDGKSLKCESLVKPIFFLYMSENYVRTSRPNDVAKTVRFILMEYIGRCLSKYISIKGSPYTDFFAEFLADEYLKRNFFKTFMSDVKASIAGSEILLLESYYTFEEASKAAKQIAQEHLVNQKKKLTTHLPLKIHVERLKKLKNVSLAGDISWFTLKVFSKEIGLADAVIDELFSEKNLFVYTAHALQYRESRARLSHPTKTYSESVDFVSKKVLEECSQNLLIEFYAEHVKSLEESWLKAYQQTHTEVIKPMSLQQIITEARIRGIKVTDDTFDQVYKRYRPDTRLLGNACQARACPYFLLPSKRYNQHATVERKYLKQHFVHGLHRNAYLLREKDEINSKHNLEQISKTGVPSIIPEQVWKRLSTEFRNLQVIYKEIAQGSV
ncbi:hypothetical protein SK128_000813 [Halocaridina rubra]|uniref:VWFA domain-containing protein n=1 Tax=Halocaridina rubra TaxID=373956 RepID=A0AAN8X9X5_HALRR